MTKNGSFIQLILGKVLATLIATLLWIKYGAPEAVAVGTALSILADISYYMSEMSTKVHSGENIDGPSS